MTLPLVLDASAVIGWLMPDERWPDVEAAIADAADLLVPWLFWVELRNVLITQERRGRLPVGGTEKLLAAVDRLALIYDTTPDSAAVLRLARDFRLSAYNALYLELAQRQSASLFTTDHALTQAARSSGVPTL